VDRRRITGISKERRCYYIVKKRRMMLECVETTDQFIIGQNYECLGLSSGYAEMIDSEGVVEIMSDKYFKIRKSKERK
jgi:hypothetical protein